MSRYLAFVLLALSAATVLAAPAEVPSIPPVPDLSTVTKPVVGARSNHKVYSPNTLHKRDWKYPTSTRDCRMSEVPEGSTTLSYTRDGTEYSEECLTSLALSVPFESRKSCRTTGLGARGYDEECLFKKAFDEDWKFDVEKAKAEELAWRAVNPTRPSSDAWRTLFPATFADCAVVVEVAADVEVKRQVEGGEEKEVKGGKKVDTTRTSDALRGWSPYSVTPAGDVFSADCLALLVLRAKIVVDLGTCPVEPTSTGLVPHRDLAAPVRNFGLPLLGRSSTELDTRQNLTVDAVLSVLVALRLGCLVQIVAKLVAALGINIKLLDGPIKTVGTVVVDGLIAAVLAL
jgi:hypothetical protein